MKECIDTIGNYFIMQRLHILRVFNGICLGIVFFIVAALILSRINDTMLFFFYGWGSLLGKAALVFFITTLLPGMGERLGIKNKVLSIVRIYRRQVGILMYLSALLHVVLSKIITLSSFKELLQPQIFEIMGTLSLLILFFLFITSNTVSLIRLKLNWYRIHRLIYIGMFSIFLHVAFINLSIWSLLMGTVLILQLVSFIVVYKKTGSLTGGKPI